MGLFRTVSSVIPCMEVLSVLKGSPGLMSVDHWLWIEPSRTWTTPISQMLAGSALAVSTSTALKVRALNGLWAFHSIALAVLPGLDSCHYPMTSVDDRLLQTLHRDQ